ncbi:MAG: antitoxin VbhA family protein [Cellvibrio sp.]
MQKLPSIFDDLDVPGIIVECSNHQAKRFGAFTEDAMTMEDARLSVEIEKRREIVEQVDAIHRLEGFKPGDAPDWFRELTEDYVLGKVSAEAVTQKALEFIKNGRV